MKKLNVILVAVLVLTNIFAWSHRASASRLAQGGYSYYMSHANVGTVYSGINNTNTKLYGLSFPDDDIMIFGRLAWSQTFYVNGLNDANNHWNLELRRVDNGATFATFQLGGSLCRNLWTGWQSCYNTYTPSIYGYWRGISVYAVKVGGPGALTVYPPEINFGPLS